MKNIFKILTAALFVAINFSLQAQQTNGAVKNVDVTEFKKLVDAGNGIILDVRTPQEISQGYINNASMINLYDADFAEKINLISKDKEIYVYCKAGGRSTQASEILKTNGFKKIYNLKGGFMVWEANQYPVSKPKNYVDENIKQLKLADFQKILKTNKPVLIDFHTLWCAPCKKMAPVMDKIEKDYKNKALVSRIDLDKSKEVGKAYNIQGVPVFVLFKNGKEIWRHSGIISEEDLKNQINKIL